MQDFTKLNMSKLNDSKTLNLTKKSNWLNDRLNRDNFWNLMFFVLYVVGFKLAFLIPKPVGGCIMLATFFGVPILLSLTSAITFNEKENLFTISDGRKINKTGVEFMLLCFFTFGITALFGLILDKHSPDNKLFDLLFKMTPAFVPTLYCIIRNFPISVFFHKNAWYRKNQNNSNQYEGPYDGFNLTCNPSNSWHISNIHHDRHR